MIDISTFTLFVFVLLLLGIVKDIILLSNWLEKWLRSRGNGDLKSPASTEKLIELLRGNSAQVSLEIRESFDRHFMGLMAENRKTNDLLRQFLIGQRIIAKNVHGIDLDID